MLYGNLVLRIGGFHMELTMMRSYINLTWDIHFQEISKYSNFVSPKAQITLKKVSDFHKSTDIFLASRVAKICELLVPYVQYCNNLEINPSAIGFEEWMETVVKDKNVKLAVQIESLYGTCIWLYHAAARANYPKLSNAAINVFCGLFHINGNPNYSQIELFDRYLINLCRLKRPLVAQNLEKNEGTNLTNLPYAAQKIDARHEEYNQKGQNIFQGENVDDFVQAFSIVDDLWALR